MFKQPTQPPVQWLLSVFPWEVKLLGWKVDHSPPPSANYLPAWHGQRQLYLFTLYSKW